MSICLVQLYSDTGDTNHLRNSIFFISPSRPLNITFLLLALSSLHLVGFESSLINFTCPHFCPQLFIGPYYENLNLLFDYWLLPLEAYGFWCIIEHSWSHKWLLHIRIKVWVLWMSNHLAEECFSPVSRHALYAARETWSLVIFQSNWCTAWRKKVTTCFAVLQLRISLAQCGNTPNRFVLLVSRSISVLCCGPVGALR